MLVVASITPGRPVRGAVNKDTTCRPAGPRIQQHTHARTFPQTNPHQCTQHYRWCGRQVRGAMPHLVLPGATESEYPNRYAPRAAFTPPPPPRTHPPTQPQTRPQPPTQHNASHTPGASGCACRTLPASEQRGAAGSAQRRAAVPRPQPHAAKRQRVNVGCGYHGVPREPNVPVAHVVDKQHDDIWHRRGTRGARQQACGRSPNSGQQRRHGDPRPKQSALYTHAATPPMHTAWGWKVCGCPRWLRTAPGGSLQPSAGRPFFKFPAMHHPHTRTPTPHPHAPSRTLTHPHTPTHTHTHPYTRTKCYRMPFSKAQDTHQGHQHQLRAPCREGTHRRIHQGQVQGGRWGHGHCPHPRRRRCRRARRAQPPNRSRGDGGPGQGQGHTVQATTVRPPRRRQKQRRGGQGGQQGRGEVDNPQRGVKHAVRHRQQPGTGAGWR
jgi:hypothetical protein